MHIHKISHIDTLLGKTVDTGDNHLVSNGVNDWRCNIFQEAQVAKNILHRILRDWLFFSALYMSLRASKVVFPRFQVLMAGHTFATNLRALRNLSDRHNIPCSPLEVSIGPMAPPLRPEHVRAAVRKRTLAYWCQLSEELALVSDQSLPSAVNQR